MDKLKLKNLYSLSKTKKPLNRMQEVMLYFLAIIFCYIVGWIFYHNALFALLFSMVGFFLPPIVIKEIVKIFTEQKKLQFREMLYCLASLVKSGLSLEVALCLLNNELKKTYKNANTVIIKETENIKKMIELGATPKEALESFAKNIELKEADELLIVIHIAKNIGGDLSEAIKNTCNLLTKAMQIEREIKEVLSEKTIEYKVISFCPFVLYVILCASSKNYMEAMYSCAEGIIAITIALGIYLFSIILSSKMLKFKI